MIKLLVDGSNNTNKLSPQELQTVVGISVFGSNNTNKLSPQELQLESETLTIVQIIQINLVLKNVNALPHIFPAVQIIQINLVLKNRMHTAVVSPAFK